MGDRTAGMVMEAGLYPYSQGFATIVFYGFEITHADLIMTDGQSLEHVGVVPDKTALPSPEDLALGRDPVLARAAQIAHINLNPVQAGKLFPIEWAPL